MIGIHRELLSKKCLRMWDVGFGYWRLGTHIAYHISHIAILEPDKTLFRCNLCKLGDGFDTEFFHEIVFVGFHCLVTYKEMFGNLPRGHAVCQKDKDLLFPCSQLFHAILRSPDRGQVPRYQFVHLLPQQITYGIAEVGPAVADHLYRPDKVLHGFML